MAGGRCPWQIPSTMQKFQSGLCCPCQRTRSLGHRGNGIGRGHVVGRGLRHIGYCCLRDLNCAADLGLCRESSPTFPVPPFSPHNPSSVCLCSPHPVKPLSAVPAEGISDKKQSRSSLSTALSSGLEKLKTVTSGGIQPVAPAPQLGQTVDTKRLKVRPRVPGAI